MSKTRKVVAVIVLNSEGKFLILKRASDKKVHANLWNLPSGGVKLGETLEEAGKRETLEETGLTISDIVVGPNILVKVSNELKLDINHLLAKTVNGEVNLNFENSEYMWVTPQESLNYKFAVSTIKVITILKYFALL